MFMSKASLKNVISHLWIKNLNNKRKPAEEELVNPERKTRFKGHENDNQKMVKEKDKHSDQEIKSYPKPVSNSENFSP